MDSETIQPLELISERLISIGESAVALVPQIGIALVVVLLTWAIAAGIGVGVDQLLKRTSFRPSLKSFLRLMAKIGCWVVGLMIAAVIVFPNLSPANIIAGLGLGSVAIGFAFKDVFENFLSGIFILLRREMRIGDHIACEGIEGQVEDISIRETHIRQTDGQLVIVPNATLFKNALTIRTDLDLRRVTIMCGIAYGEDVASARGIIEAAVADCPTVVRGDKPIQIFAQSFGSSSIDFEVTWWTGSRPVDVRTSRDEVVEAVKAALDRKGIEIPFPYRTLTFAEPLPLTRSGSGGEQEAA